MQWLEEHQFLESLIQIICGTYAAEPAEPPARPSSPAPPASPPRPEKGERERGEKLNCNHTHDGVAAPQGDKGNAAAPDWGRTSAVARATLAFVVAQA